MSCQLVHNETCTYNNAGGIEYQEFSCQYKILEPLYSDYEKCFDLVEVSRWSSKYNNYSSIPIAIVLLHVIAIYWGENATKHRKAYSMRVSLACWNFLFCAFSFMCMVRVTPHLLHNIISIGGDDFRDLLCMDPQDKYSRGSTGLWMTLFTLSKFAGLLETIIFGIAHKKPATFYHWWHHVTLSLFSWYAFINRIPFHIFFVASNSAVNAMVYGCRYLISVNRKPKWLNPMWITAAQLVQMVTGFIVTTISAFFYYTSTQENPCDIDESTLIPCFAMFGIHSALLYQFLIYRYFNTSKSRRMLRQQMKAVISFSFFLFFVALVLN